MSNPQLKLEETISSAERYHDMNDAQNEALFRKGFASLLALFYSTEKQIKNARQLRGDESTRRVLSDASMQKRQSIDVQSTFPSSPNVRSGQGAAGELVDFLAGEAEAVESKIQQDMVKGINVNDAVRVSFPKAAGAATATRFSGRSIRISLADIDLPDSVLEAIRQREHDGGRINWRANYNSTRPASAARPLSVRPASARSVAGALPPRPPTLPLSSRRP